MFFNVFLNMDFLGNACAILVLRNLASSPPSIEAPPNAAPRDPPIITAVFGFVPNSLGRVATARDPPRIGVTARKDFSLTCRVNSGISKYPFACFSNSSVKPSMNSLILLVVFHLSGLCR